MVKVTGVFVAGLLLWSSPAWSKPLVVLDPGHGGHRTGAATRGGILEKNIALSIARHARKRLEAEGIKVIMTRSRDVHVPNGRRPELANRKGAVAFVSIHNNACTEPARHGVETYILSPHASDGVAAEVLRSEASYENESLVDTEEGTIKDGDLAFILNDLARTAAHADSARLATAIQRVLGQVSGLKPDRGLRQAPFHVLKGAKMAAVLVEIGYVSNTRQGRYLSSGSGQRAAGQALARGILNYLRSR